MRRAIRQALWGLMGVGLTGPALPAAAQHAAPSHPKEPPPAVSPNPGSVPTVPAACRAGQRDDFTDAKLNRARWTTVVRETADLRLADGQLIIPTTRTDIIFAGGDTPNIVLQALPPGPFTATAKLTLQARRAWQQAGLVIYGDDDNYAKLVLVALKHTADDANARVFQFIREGKGEPPSLSATARLGTDFPDVAWVRLTSDGRTLRAAYSTDGTQFTDMPESKSVGGDDAIMAVRLAGIANPKIGLLAMAGSTQAPVIEARFDWFELCRPAAALGPRQ